MAKLIKTEILIHAKPEKIWEILTDFQKYPTWNPFITYIEGQMNIGNKIKVKIEPPEAKAMTFKPNVTAFETNKLMSWLGVLLFRGLFDGEHKFELIDNQDGTTTFIQSENFIGILVPLFAKQLDNSTKNGFIEMNKKLKELAEK